MTNDTLDGKYGLIIILMALSLIVGTLIVKFNWLDFSYLLFVGSCFIRYYYITKDE